jgi:hypothetical protein
LGELNLAYKWFEKTENLEPNMNNANLKKYATACHVKLEQFLEEQHESVKLFSFKKKFK